MASRLKRPCQVSVDIDAAVETVWELVSDPTRTGMEEEADEAEELYLRAFSSDPKPARSSPMVAPPVAEALVSIEAVAVKCDR